jgi:hypothetical protein
LDDDADDAFHVTGPSYCQYQDAGHILSPDLSPVATTLSAVLNTARSR